MKKGVFFILKGNIVYSKNQKEFSICENGYVVCKDGIVEGVYKTLPFKFGGNPIRDYKDALIRAAKAKVKSLDLTEYGDRTKLLKHLMTRGFEAELSMKMVSALVKRMAKD